MVVVLLGVIAAFGMPNYTRAREKADEREAVANLRMVVHALELYKNRNGGYPGFDMPQAGDINTTLNLGIIEQNMDYNCVVAGADNTCTAVSPYGWQVQYSTATKANGVYCSVAGCPSCPALNCSYAGLYE